MDIKKQELGLTKAAKRNLLRLEGVETLQDLVDMYSEQELLEDQRFEKRTQTWTSIIECLDMYGLKLYPTFYERKKGLGEIPSATDAENMLLTDLELPEALIGKMKYWKYLKTLGDLSRSLKEYGLKHSSPRDFNLAEFSEETTVPVDEAEVKEFFNPPPGVYLSDSDRVYGASGYRYRRHPTYQFPKEGGRTVTYTYDMKVQLDRDEKKLLIRTLALYGLYPEHARMRPTL